MLTLGLSGFRLPITLFLLTLGVSVVDAQDLAFHHYSVTEGVGSATVYSCMQDNKGYLWFATESGVSRFNGQKFERYSVDDGLSDSEIFKIFQDSYNRIWFMSFNGHLSYYLNGKFYNEKSAPFLKKVFCGQSIMGMYEDGKRRLWAFSSGNFLIMIDNEKVIQFDFKFRCYQAGGININIDAGGVPEFRYANKVFRYDDKKKQILYFMESDFAYSIPRITYSESVLQTKIVQEGVILVKGDSSRLLVPNPRSDKLLYFTSVYLEKNGYCWIGTLESGVKLFRMAADSIKLIKTILPEIQVSDIVKDHEGNMWFCTKDDGIFMLPAFGRNTIIYPKSQKFPTSNIYAVYCDRKGRIWTGGDRGNVCCIDSSGVIIKTYRLVKFDKNNYRVNTITEDHDGNIWLVTSMYVHKITPEGIESVVYLTKNKRALAGKAITVTENGDVYLAYFAGVLKYNKKTNCFARLSGHPYPVRTFYIHANKNRLLVANNEGLCEYKNDSLYPLYLHDSRLRNRFSSIRSLNDSVTVLGTFNQGVFIYKNDSIVQHLNVKNGLPSNDCTNLFVKNHDLWIVTDLGLVKYFNRKDQQITRDLSQTISGLYSNDIRGVHLNKGKIYCATARGLIVMNENEYIESPKGPPVLFLYLKANNVNYPFNGIVKLGHYQNNVSVGFESISFNNSDQIQYEYLLGDNSDKPKQTKSNEILLTRIPSGAYNLKIRAKIANGNWGPSSILSFTIAEPYWETSGFMGTILVLFVGFISLPFYLYYKRRLRNRWLQLDRLAAVNNERQRISYDLHDELGSALTSITMNAEIIKHKKIYELNFNKELEDLSAYAKDANDKMSDIVWAVSVSNDHLASLASNINEFISEFESRTGIRGIKKIEENLEQLMMRPEARKNIFLVVKEAFHNIQKHACATQVVFELFISNHILNISIKDNGQGFDESEIVDSSVGLISMRKRMESIGGELIIVTKSNFGTELMLRYNLIENANT